jgi:hypothetical protein
MVEAEEAMRDRDPVVAVGVVPNLSMLMTVVAALAVGKVVPNLRMLM